jgi:ABC-type sugar transport system permease subunit
MAAKRLRFCYLMVAPALLLVLMMGIYPMIDTFRISLLQYDLLRIPTEGTPFVGFDNYLTILQNPRFVRALVNTIVFVVIVVSFVLAVGVFIAQVLNHDFRGRVLLRSIVLIPWFIPPVVASGIWLWMFEPQRSPINQGLRFLSLTDSNIRFLTDSATFADVISIPMISVALVRAWGGMPFVILMVLAAMQSIPKDVYEAAEIDGASVIQRFAYITLPMLRPVLAILMTLLFIGGIGAFEVNYVLTRGGPQDLTNVLAVLAYQEAFTFFRFDLAAAISNIILLITGPIAFLYIRAQIRER